jgi:hypothetical protein
MCDVEAIRFFAENGLRYLWDQPVVPIPTADALATIS